MKILVVNAGSSSLKYQLIDMSNENVLAIGLCERIGIDGSVLTHKAGDVKKVIEKPMTTHKEAIAIVLDALCSKEYGAIGDLKEINAVGHRVVHGGEAFNSSVLIDDEVLQAIEDAAELAPLHNPANIMGIKACMELFGDVPNVAVFDTAFHQTMPEKAYLYAIPYEYYEKDKIRRYGFHGTSHGYIAKQAAAMMGKSVEDLKIVTCHLGNGSSIAAVNGGKSVDTSMGFTPLEGVIMGTRSGDLDPAIVGFLCEKKGLSASEVINILNKKSGLKGASQLSNDFRDLLEASEKGNKRAAVTIEMMVYRIIKYIGAYAAAMNGIDAIVFAGGIGENAIPARAKVLEGLSFLGVDFDAEANNCRGKAVKITKDGSKVSAFVIPTNEELVIARDTMALAK